MMTHEQIAAVIIAHGQGKKIECDTGSGWFSFATQGTLGQMLSWIARGDQFRPAPEPKLRPWKPEEGVGKVVRYKKNGNIVQIVGWNAERNLFAALCVSRDEFFRTASSPKDVLEKCEQLDGKPCGVEESE